MAYCVTGKIGHVSEDKATEVALQLIERGRANELKVYHCPYCI